MLQGAVSISHSYNCWYDDKEKWFFSANNIHGKSEKYIPDDTANTNDTSYPRGFIEG